MTAPLLLGAISAAILLQVAIGTSIAFWRLQRNETAPLPIGSDDATAIATGAWAGWRDFRVGHDVFEDEARTQRSLILTPVDGQPLPDFAPGQYLTLSLDLPASLTKSKRTIIRCYSLSDQPDSKAYRITVKRMPAPSTRPDLPAGAASSFLHDTVQIGDMLKVKVTCFPFPGPV